VRLLVLDSEHHRYEDQAIDQLGEFFRPGDLIVVNDAATLPASLRGETRDGAEIEARLVRMVDDQRWEVVLFGPGDWRDKTEERPPPPPIPLGARLRFGSVAADLVNVSPLSARLVELRFDRGGPALWEALYRVGKPIQYSYLERTLELWSVQTVYANRPWAVEMPSAGRPLTWAMLLSLRQRGIQIASITHAAGLSATGDPRIDEALPLPERYDVPQATVEAIARARAGGGRIVAVGTTVVRALEGSARENGGVLVAGEGVTDLVIDERFVPRFVDGLLTGMHEPSESHFRLLGAFASREDLERSLAHAIAGGYRTHEFGDVSLILAGALGPQNGLKAA
jgi:S-adenosylmethionine:tRNA ribosyltransferase-isomerase